MGQPSDQQGEIDPNAVQYAHKNWDVFVKYSGYSIIAVAGILLLMGFLLL